MVLKLNFNLEAWLSGVTIEADSEEAAIEKLHGMPLGELVSTEGGIDVKAIEFSDIDTELISYNVIVEVSDIKFATSGKDVSFSQLTELEKSITEPIQLKLSDITGDDDIEEAIRDELWIKFSPGHEIEIDTFSYDIIATY